MSQYDQNISRMLLKASNETRAKDRGDKWSELTLKGATEVQQAEEEWMMGERMVSFYEC